MYARGAKYDHLLPAHGRRARPAGRAVGTGARQGQLLTPSKKPIARDSEPGQARPPHPRYPEPARDHGRATHRKAGQTYGPGHGILEQDARRDRGCRTGIQRNPHKPTRNRITRSLSDEALRPCSLSGTYCTDSSCFILLT